MIWFACKSCGKKHSRPDAEAGAMVFCQCGRGNRVPFSSTAAPDLDIPEVLPAPRAIPVPAAVPVPVPIPVPVPSARPAPRAVPVAVPVDESHPATTLLPPSEPPLPYRKTPRRYRKVDPHACWHHEELPAGGTCAACRLPFCIDCLVELNGAQLCGPCKNFRAAAAGQPVRVLPLASAALVCSLVAAPVAALLSIAGAGIFHSEGSTGGAVLMCVLAMLLLGASLTASILAVRRLEAESRVGGRGLAAGGLCVSLAGLAWCLCVLAVVIGRGAAR